jgi:hypothetical protein
VTPVADPDDAARQVPWNTGAPEAVAKLGDLSRRMKPTAIGFLVELTTEEWAAIAIEHQLSVAGDGVS